MPRTVKPRLFNGKQGVNTTQLDDVSQFPIYADLSGMRVDRGPFQRRLGKTRLTQFSQIANIISFDGTNDKVSVPTDSRVVPFGTRFTLEALFQTGTIASVQTIIGKSAAGATGVVVTHETNGTIKTLVTDSSAGTTTITTAAVYAISTDIRYQLKRDGAALTVTVNGTETTGTMSATLSLASGAFAFGADNTSNYLTGRIDFVRLLRTCATSQRWGYLRLPDPRASFVLFDFVVSGDANGTCFDRGPYEMHAAVTGSPTLTGTPLAANSDPVLAIATNLDINNERQGYVIVRDRCYPVDFIS